MTLPPVQKLDEMERPSLSDLTNPPRNPTFKPTRRPRPTNVPTVAPTTSMTPTTEKPVRPSRNRPTQAPFSPFLDIVRPTVLDTSKPAVVLKIDDDDEVSAPTEAPSAGSTSLETTEDPEETPVPTNKPTRKRRTKQPTEEPTPTIDEEDVAQEETAEPTWSPTTAKPRRTKEPTTEAPTESTTTMEPTSQKPTSKPTIKETLAPVFTEETSKPTQKPTGRPTVSPTKSPTAAPTAKAIPVTPEPTKLPTNNPTEGVTFSVNTVTDNNIVQIPDGTDITYHPGNLTRREQGLVLSQGLTSKLIATTGRPVRYDAQGTGASSSSIANFHGRPDAGACFVDTRPSNDGGWIYVSNSEMRPEDVPDAVNKNNKGGVGAITFDKYGNVKNYEMILSQTTWNCGGGRTPWNTWVSCEEAPQGVIWQGMLGNNFCVGYFVCRFSAHSAFLSLLTLSLSVSPHFSHQ